MVFVAVSVFFAFASLLIYRQLPIAWPTLDLPFGVRWAPRSEIDESSQPQSNITNVGSDPGSGSVGNESGRDKSDKSAQDRVSPTRWVDRMSTDSPPTAVPNALQDLPPAPRFSLEPPPCTAQQDLEPRTSSIPISQPGSERHDRAPPKLNVLSNTGTAMLPPSRPSPSAIKASIRAAPANRVQSTPQSGLSNGSATLGIPPSTSTRPPQQRQKVILSPGHSPLDWARLQTSGTNLRGLSEPRLIRVSRTLLRRHNKRNDAWSNLGGKVYNITPYLPFHPGGEAELMKAAGRDGTKLFRDIHSWVNWENMLSECLVGIAVDEDEERPDTAANRWEEMD